MDANEIKIGLVDDQTLSAWQQDAVWRRLAADRAAALYEYEKPRVEAAIKKRLTKRNGAVDDYMLRQEMEANWKLIDITKTHAWLRDEANSLNLAIQTQLALRGALRAAITSEVRKATVRDER